MEKQIEIYNLNRFVYSKLLLRLVCFYHNAEIYNYQYLFLFYIFSVSEASSLDSQMPITAAVVDFAVKPSSLILGNKLLIFSWMKCKPLFLKTFHSFEHCRVPWWTWPGFKLISPESNNNNWEKGFKFLYLSFEIKKWFMLGWVSNDWVFSQVSI